MRVGLWAGTRREDFWHICCCFVAVLGLSWQRGRDDVGCRSTQTVGTAAAAAGAAAAAAASAAAALLLLSAKTVVRTDERCRGSLCTVEATCAVVPYPSRPRFTVYLLPVSAEIFEPSRIYVRHIRWHTYQLIITCPHCSQYVRLRIPFGPRPLLQVLVHAACGCLKWRAAQECCDVHPCSTSRLVSGSAYFSSGLYFYINLLFLC